MHAGSRCVGLTPAETAARSASACPWDTPRATEGRSAGGRRREGDQASPGRGPRASGVRSAGYAGAEASGMEARRGRDAQWLDAQHDSAGRLRRRRSDFSLRWRHVKRGSHTPLRYLPDPKNSNVNTVAKSGAIYEASKQGP